MTASSLIKNTQENLIAMTGSSDKHYYIQDRHCCCDSITGVVYDHNTGTPGVAPDDVPILQARGASIA
jgi:hypothetical protein